MQFETQRLIIRPWQPNKDARQAMDIFGDAQVMAWVDGDERDTSIRQVQGRLQSYRDYTICGQSMGCGRSMGSWAVEKKDTRRVIGHVMLMLMPDMRVTPTHRRRLYSSISSKISPKISSPDASSRKEGRDKEGLPTDYFEICWQFRPSSWGFGYASEAATRVMQYAFEELNLPMVLAITQPENRRSVALAQRLGMENDGLTTRCYGGEPLLLYKLCSRQVG